MLSLYVIKIVLAVPIIKTAYGLCIDTKDCFYNVAYESFFKEDRQDLKNRIRIKIDRDINM